MSGMMKNLLFGSTEETEYKLISTERGQFGGFAGEYEFQMEASRLSRLLGETAPYQSMQYFCCGYDSPMKPYSRRNEAWFTQEEF